MRKAAALICALALCGLGAGAASADMAPHLTKAQLHRSATVGAVLALPTVCVPDHQWRAYLRSIEVYTDAAWVLSVWATYDWEVDAVTAPDGSCRAVLRSWLYPDSDVAIPLYYFAELASPADSNCAIEHTFYKLRRAFGIRRTVTVGDYFPPLCHGPRLAPDPPPTRRHP